jgi:hypothetical protein
MNKSNNKIGSASHHGQIPIASPKVFISYSWSGQSRQEMVKEWADRLLSDGIKVTIDLYDLKAGQDKFGFMEQMVTDPEITHVLVVCDKSYAEKADQRIRGVGTESQIISQEVYSKVDQVKFIPIVCEFSDGEPYLPVYMKSRVWIDFSTLELINTNWERLLRMLYGKPLHEKPALGPAPSFLLEESTPSTPIKAKLNSLKQAILQGKPAVGLYRKEFLASCIEGIAALRVRTRPDLNLAGEKLLAECKVLTPIRDHIIDWILLEAHSSPSAQFTDALHEFLEQLMELKERPHRTDEWVEIWSEAHSLFIYETFLYVVAALLKSKAFTDLHDLFTTHYIAPKSERYRDENFLDFGAFHTESQTLHSVLSPPAGRRFLSPAAELVKRHATREDITFEDLIQADLLILLMTFIAPNVLWYPQLQYYSRFNNQFPFFKKATQHKFFKNLTVITGIEDADELRKIIADGHERLGTVRWNQFDERNFTSRLNAEKWDTLK